SEAITKKTEDTNPTPGTGHEKQSWLVGEHIYLRTVQETDAEYAASWRQGMIRRSVSATESWIEDDLKDEDDMHLLVVRKSDDRPVGSLERSSCKHSIWYPGYVDPLFGDEGQTWLGEAYILGLQWAVDEQQRIVAHVEDVPDTQQIVLKMLQDIVMTGPGY